MSYAESESDVAADDEDVFKPIRKRTATRPSKRRKISESPDQDDYQSQEDAADVDGMYRTYPARSSRQDRFVDHITARGS